MEVDIGFDNAEPFNIDFNEGPKHDSSSSNLGVGIELLMNDKKIPTSGSDVDIGDLNKLENVVAENIEPLPNIAGILICKNGEIILNYSGNTIFDNYKNCKPVSDLQTYVRIGIYRTTDINNSF